DALGDLSFERGDFDAAACWYRLLLPAGKDGHATSTPPDLARAQAKFLLARIFGHKRLGATVPLSPSLQGDLDDFGRKHPEASGKLAGREGKYADLLQALARDRGLEASPGLDWPTLGGNPQRFRPLPVDEDLLDRLSVMARKPFIRLNLESR